jgi:iron(III) transport system ATP-binding protein
LGGVSKAFEELPMGAPFLSISSLTKRFGDVTVLNDVSFELGKGECVALVGPSGCGKTTTLRCVGGLEHADSGSIRLEGKTLSEGPRAVVPQDRQMGMVFQSYSVWPHLTVFENVAFGLKLRRVSRSDTEKRVRDCLALMNIGHLAERKSFQLSGGQLQRVALARTLVVEPKVVLFDEPLSNLDAQLRAHMRTEIRALLKRLNMSAVYVTHDQSEASVVADRTAVMHQGRIKQIGAWKDLYFVPSSRFVAEFMGAGNLLDGSVKGIEGSRVIVDVKGTTLQIDEDRCAFEPRIGSAITVYAPREAIVLSALGQSGITGRVTQVLPGPSIFEVSVDTPLGTLMSVKVATDDVPQVGEQCSVALLPMHLSGFPYEPDHVTEAH